MIAEVCHFYGWTDDHVMNMPASRFFSMLRASRRLSRMEKVHDCYISRASNMPKEDFFETVSWFDDFGKDPEDKPVVTQERGPEPLRGQDAKMAVMRAFAGSKNIDRTVKH